MDLTFKDVCSFIKKDNSKLVDAVDKLLALPLLCSPLFMSGLALLPLLTAKNELTKLVKGVFDHVTKKKDNDYVARHERMKIAYGLICYTAFFEALDRELPADLRKQIELTKEERTAITRHGTKKASGTSTDYQPELDKFSEVPITFPHPTESVEEQQTRLDNLYHEMAQGFKEFITKLSFWDSAGEKNQSLISQAIEKVPAEANQCFEAQYFELSRKFEDFAVWASLHEHKKSKQLLESLSKYVRGYANLSQDTKAHLDVGLKKLHELAVTFPSNLATAQAEEIVAGLRKHYLARINEPIVESKDDVEDGKFKLSFPKVVNAFVPQSYRVLRQGNRALALEDEETWKSIVRRDDLGAFLLSYLSSPYSADTPLIVLGHPGSGKSLLTTVLAAQLLSPHYTAIRVPLREVNSDAGVIPQIEEHIGRITNIRVDSWAKISGAFKNNPPIVILDGYDELLQASGKVFAGYLKDVQTFQKNEAEQGRPVRVIVTSRVTLIDKAIIPLGSSIVRLLEFDTRQRDKWISIWNGTNSTYFDKSRVDPFSLPMDSDPDAAKVLSLAEQPLLLLMLALYDSDSNRLRDSKIRDRTVLYESLLRRFVERERMKSKEFENRPAREQKKEVDLDMQRLGVAAIGMYNRRKLHILSKELNDDLKFFDLEKVFKADSGRLLTQAELVLGSFFFVHKSTATQKGGIGEDGDGVSAFEFLHNTFGEFLVADFLVRQALVEVNQLRALGNDQNLLSERSRKLTDADGLSRFWFACLVYTPLFTRPVVVEMIREWIGHVLQRRKLSRKAFLAELDDIVQNQISRLLSKRDMPSIMQKDEVREGFRSPFGSHPLLGHLAIYGLNLILVRIIVDEGSFIFDEGSIGSHEDGARPWDQLTFLWRSWFSIENLAGMTAVLVAERNESSLTLRAKEKISVSESQNRLEAVYNIGSSMADNILAGLSGLMLVQGSSGGAVELDDVEQRLLSEGIHVELEVALRKLDALLNEPIQNVDAFIKYAEIGFEAAWHLRRYGELEQVLHLIRRLVRRISSRHDMLSEPWEHLRSLLVARLATFEFVSLAEKNADTALSLIEIVSLQGGTHPSDRTWRRHFERVLHRRTIGELAERSPVVAVALLDSIVRWGVDARYIEQGVGEIIFEQIDLGRLAEQDPSKVALLVQLTAQFGGERSLKRMIDRFFGRAFNIKHPEDWTSLRPEVAIELLKAGLAFGKSRWRPIIGDKFLRSLFGGFSRKQFGQINPESAIQFLCLAHQAGATDAARYLGEILLHQMPLGELIESNPKWAFSLLEIVMDLGLGFERFATDVFRRPRMLRWLKLTMEAEPSFIATALRVARMTGSERGEPILRSVHDFVSRAGPNHRWLADLRLSSVPDILWFAKVTGKHELSSRMHALLQDSDAASDELFAR